MIVAAGDARFPTPELIRTRSRVVFFNLFHRRTPRTRRRSPLLQRGRITDKMFDLNLSIVSNGGGNFDGNNCDGWSGETSAANGEGESSSSNDDSGAFTFNFDASNNSIDRGLTSTESALVTRDLFPVSRLDESDRVSRHYEAAAAPDHGHRRFILPRAAVQEEVQQVQAVQARKSRRGPRSRSSQYRGVTFYRRTGRWESHIWDCGKQVYLGGFDTAFAAARAYDRAAIKFRGVEADINFNLGDYEDMKQVMNLPKDEFVQMLRRQSNGFSRGGSKYKGGLSLQREFLGKNKYDKAALMFSGETVNGSSQHDLNLNLGMSASSPHKSGAQTTTKYLQQLQGGNSVSNFISNPTLEGVPVASKHPILGNGLDAKFVPNNEERERSGYLSQMEVANLAWRMNGQDRTTAAASSGFSSPAPSGSTSTVPFDFSSRSNTLAFYSWMHPPS